jgi:ABC-type branched-subunit amino acid transport system substrate-binding protein
MLNTRRLGAILSLATLFACSGDEAATTAAPDAATSGLKADKGVDVATKTIKIGTLNDESGPAAVIGKPFAAGKRLLATQINAGGSGLLPEGWTVELVERDHAYNPQKSTQAFKEIADEVLFVGTSFGTPNTLPLRPLLEAANVAAFPASLSSEMAKHKHTPPIGPSYILEAKRAMDWVVSSVDDNSTIKAGIVYQQDDYGKDGHMGWMAAAAAHGVTVVAEQTVAPGQKDFTAVITGLKDAGAEVVMLTVLPSATGPILGTAAQLKYMPTWVASTPAWIDMFFKPEVIPSGVFANYHQMNGMPFWGEDVAGMDTFLAAWEAHGAELGSPDFYTLMSYIQGMVQIEAANMAIAAGDITRAGYLAQLTSIEDWNAGGMIQPLSLTAFPYETGTQTRVLKPDFGAKSWTVVAPYAVAGQAPAAAEPVEG